MNPRCQHCAYCAAFCILRSKIIPHSLAVIREDCREQLFFMGIKLTNVITIKFIVILTASKFY
jgi:hypothetical protein